MNNINISYRSLIAIIALTLAAVAFFGVRTPAGAQDEAPPVEVPASPEVVSSPEGSIEPGEPAGPETTGSAGQAPDSEGLQPLDLYPGSGVDPSFVCIDDTVDGTPDGICQYFGVNGIQTAINDFATRGGSGLISIEAAGYTAPGNVSINGIPLLTGLVGAGSSQVTWTFTNTFGFSVSNMPAGFTLKGMAISGNKSGDLVNFNSNAGTLTLDDLAISNTNPLGNGLTVTSHSGTVKASGLKVNRNGEHGARIETSGAVTINNSSFDLNNGPFALKIISGGGITLNGITASSNYSGDGAYLEAVSGITIRNSQFNSNQNGIDDTLGYGVWITPATKGNILIENSHARYNQEDNLQLNTLSGTVTLKNVDASGTTYGYGVYIDNCTLAVSCTAPAKAVTITDLVAEYADSEALIVRSNGAITVTNLTANYSGNGTGGVLLFNHQATGAPAVSITNASMNNSEGTGLVIRSKGSVTMNGISSSNNTSSGHGIFVDNSPGSGNVSLLSTNGANTVLNNQGSALFIRSKGAVIVNDLDATGNGLTNIDIDNSTGTGSVTLKNGYADYSLGAYGMDILSRGAISVSGYSVDNNVAGGGARLRNSTSTGSPTVTVKDSTFYANFGNGLEILGKGAISLTNVRSTNNFNGGDGVSIDNLAGSGNVTITGSLNNYNSGYISNQGDGIRIATNGAVTLKGIESETNNGFGIKVDNSTATSAKAVTMNDLEVSSNGIKNMQVDSKGTVTITNLLAPYVNGSTEAVLINTLGGVALKATYEDANNFYQNFSYTGTPLKIFAGGNVSVDQFESFYGGPNAISIDATAGAGSVTISNSSMAYTDGTLLHILAKGAITLNSVSTLYSDIGSGAILDNFTGTGSVTVKGGTMTNPNAYSYNFAQGLDILTNGNVSLTNVEANSNGDAGSGAGIRISDANTGSVTMTNIVATSNQQEGVLVNSRSSIALINTAASYNGPASYGVILNNTYATGASPVTVNGGTIGNNGMDNLRVLSNGTITVQDLVANISVSGYGMYLNNTSGTTAGVKLLQTPGMDLHAKNNKLDGVHILSSGAVSVAGLDSQYNEERGLYINNDSGTGLVTLTNVYAYGSHKSGIDVTTAGAVTGNNIESYYNGQNDSTGYGLRINALAGTGKVTLTGLIVDTNYQDNLKVDASNSITIKGIYSYNSTQGYGADLNNSSGSGSVSVINPNRDEDGFIDNHLDNLRIQSTGAVIIQGVWSDSSDTGFGVRVNNSLAGTSSITITNVNTSSNFGSGLDILSNGAVTINGLDAFANGGLGFNVVNNSGTAAVKITNVLVKSHSTNGGKVTTNGAVTVDSSVFESNGGYGLWIDYDTTTTAATSISRSTFSFNNMNGLFIDGGGNVTLNSLQANNNNNAGANGVKVVNNGGVGKVTVLASYGANHFKNNNTDGLNIQSNGAVSLTNLVASGNAQDGVEIDTLGAVTLSQVTTSFNSHEGLDIVTSNTVSIKNATIFGNGYSPDLSGLALTTNGFNATLTGVNILGNAKHGILAVMGAGTLTLKGSNFYGNNAANPYDADANINMVSGTLVIIP